VNGRKEVPNELWIYPRPSSTAGFSVSMSQCGYDSVKFRRVEPNQRSFTRDEIKLIMFDDYDNETANRHLNELFGRDEA
jgi:hypothetical protein